MLDYITVFSELFIAHVITDVIEKVDGMNPSTLQWPGVWDLELFVVDPKTNRVYGRANPLPIHKMHLDTAGNRYVRLSAVLEMFSPETRKEAEWTLCEILDKYSVGSLVRSTTTVTAVGDETGRVGRKVTTYISTSALMIYALLWPHCKPFQVMSPLLRFYVFLFVECCIIIIIIITIALN